MEGGGMFSSFFAVVEDMLARPSRVETPFVAALERYGSRLLEAPVAEVGSGECIVVSVFTGTVDSGVIFDAGNADRTLRPGPSRLTGR